MAVLDHETRRTPAHHLEEPLENNAGHESNNGQTSSGGQYIYLSEFHSSQAVFEERLRAHFRDEICLLAIRNTLALIHSLDDREVPSSQQQLVPEKYANQKTWLKKHCRQLKVKGL